jgi:hypothetical protein
MVCRPVGVEDIWQENRVVACRACEVAHGIPPSKDGDIIAVRAEAYNAFSHSLAPGSARSLGEYLASLRWKIQPSCRAKRVQE